MARQLETYEQALEYLYGRINYERVHSAEYTASDFKLNRMQMLLSQLGNPQEKIPAVHVAGTKGKGSTAAMIAGVLSGAGCRAGLFTSPHISAFEERMSVGGILPSPSQVVELVNSLIEPVAILDQAPRNMGPTYFEITTAMAWLYFQQQRVQLAVLEVGLGGRLDATNVCQPLVCVITSISRDHMHLLGSEIFQIAREKGGIVKRRLTGDLRELLDPKAAQKLKKSADGNGALLFQLGREKIPVPPSAVPMTVTPESATHAGPRQCGLGLWRSLDHRFPSGLPISADRANTRHTTLLLAVAAIDRLREAGWAISDPALVEALRRVRWPARIEDSWSDRPTP